MDPYGPYNRSNGTGSSSAPIRYLEEFYETQWEESSFEHGEEESFQTLPMENDGGNIRPDNSFAPCFSTGPAFPLPGTQGYSQYPRSQEYSPRPPIQGYYAPAPSYRQYPPEPTYPWVPGPSNPPMAPHTATYSAQYELTCLNCENPPAYNSVRCEFCTSFNRAGPPWTSDYHRRCIKCRALIEAPNILCHAHHGRSNLSEAEKNHLNQPGVCRDCSSREVQPDNGRRTATCMECRSRGTERRRNLDQERLSAGLCRKFGTNRLDNLTELCNECRKKTKLYNQNYLSNRAQ